MRTFFPGRPVIRGEKDRRPIVVTTLGFTQILAWGSSYYLLAVLAGPIVRDTGWPLTWVVGGLSLGLLVAALVSPRVAKVIEQRGGREVLAFSAAALAVGQLALSVAPTLALHYAAWAIIGLGMGTGLYDAAFAALGRMYGHDARTSITTVTLFGALASTLCWPLSAFLVATVGWRGACVAYAAIQAGFALPLYLWALPLSPALASADRHGDRGTVSRSPDERRSPLAMVLLAAALTLAAMLSTILSVHLLTLLEAGGIAAAAAVGLGALVGPCQVAARAIEMAIARHHDPIWTKLASVVFVAIGISTLWARAPFVAAALAFYGFGIGLESIARGTLPLAMFGPRGYATLIGRLGMPSLLGQAAAPWIGALLIEAFGPRGMLGVVASVAFLNVAIVVGLYFVARRARANCCGEDQGVISSGTQG